MVEGARLESVWGRKALAGSNPALSAKYFSMTDSYTQQQKALVRRMEDDFAKGVSASTLVPMHEDYAGDQRRCLTSLVFLPEHISGAIARQVIAPLQAAQPEQYFFPPASRHLTVKNIRTIDATEGFTENDIRNVDRLFSKVVPQFQTFDFTIEDVILFPTSVSIMAYTDELFLRLVQALDKGLKDIGVPDNKKYVSGDVFCGNTTVCRFTQKPSDAFVTAARGLRTVKIGTFRVQSILLVICNAVCHPDSLKIIGEYRLR